MGKISKITCKSCGRDWELFTGGGMLHGMLENVVADFPKAMQEGIYKSVEDMEFPVYDFSYQPAHCEYCCTIVCVPVFTPMEKKSIIGGCPVCGHEAKLIQNVAEAVCPVCGQKALQEEETGFWD
ncbi:MAG: hypothetical protein K2H40_10700 [Lachnospiraceae bacterium]|nr:hypothetical protein [Lachnospiraceae bacterium]